MASEAGLPVEERILQVLQHMGIQQAHFGARVPADWVGLASRYLHVVNSLTLVCPNNVDPDAVHSLAPRLLVFNGDQDDLARTVERVMDGFPHTSLVTLPNYSNAAWSDAVADQPEEIASTLTAFLTQRDSDQSIPALDLSESEGEVAGIRYRIRGSGPPLVLLPLGLAASQWEPVLDILSQRYCTITLGGAHLGFVAVLEARGRSLGYLGIVRNLLAEVQLEPGEVVLDVGCGTGVLDRWIIRQTPGANRIVGVDMSRYLLGEAAALAKAEGLEGAIEFREGNAESLPFPDESFDVVMACTVLEEGHADRMLAELTRVTRPGGRVAVIVRAVDMPFLVNLPARGELKAKVEVPGGNKAEHGCADATLYTRLWNVGLVQVKALPQIAPFHWPYGVMGQFLQSRMLAANLSHEEQREWREAEESAVAQGDFFFAWPHHCAVGTKPS